MDQSYLNSEQKSWSNLSGYGYLVNSQLNGSVVRTTVMPYNRLQPLSQPCTSPAVTTEAWSPPVTGKRKQELYGTCQTRR